ncbi:hypothetical protein BDA99DRAFT_534427 [Phascolomyces articulosus]|uniref:Uncharacterized protein n=1 Tax=Phascolomyces articulosus TaxID=60185 RepID=A0AAD5K705_9FUNG|nr:hypothetical protein BDA99DRAFT_534427 [Phascolomyces articulosus]
MEQYLGLPDDFEFKGTTDSQLRLLYAQSKGTTAFDFLQQQTQKENGRRNAPEHEHNLEIVENILLDRLKDVLSELKKKTEYHAVVLLYSDRKDARKNGVLPNSEAGEVAEKGMIGATFQNIMSSERNIPAKKRRVEHSRIEMISKHMREQYSKITDSGSSQFPWGEFKRCPSTDYPNVPCYIYEDKRVALIGYDFGADKKTGQISNSAIRPNNLSAWQQQSLANAIEKETVQLVETEKLDEALPLHVLPDITL